MPLDNAIAVAIGTGVFGLVILIVLWPGAKHGRRLLRRWGVTEPSEVDIQEAVLYLKRRRFWYPWLYFVIPLLGKAAGVDEVSWTVAVTLLLGGLLGELLAWRPASRGRREAMLSRRVLTDLVPAWALVLLAIAYAGGVVRTILVHEPARLWVVAGCAVVVAAVLVIAMRRPAAGDAAVDLVLRARSARVATGLALVVPGIGLHVGDLPSMLLVVVSVAAGIAVVSPSPRVAAAVG